MLWRDVAFADESARFEFLKPFIGSITFILEIERRGVSGGHHAGFKKAAQKGEIAGLKL